MLRDKKGALKLLSLTFRGFKQFLSWRLHTVNMSGSFHSVRTLLKQSVFSMYYSRKVLSRFICDHCCYSSRGLVPCIAVCVVLLCKCRCVAAGTWLALVAWSCSAARPRGVQDQDWRGILPGPPIGGAQLLASQSFKLEPPNDQAGLHFVFVSWPRCWNRKGLLCVLTGFLFVEVFFVFVFLGLGRVSFGL